MILILITQWMKDFPWSVGASFFCCLFSQVDFCARCHTMLQQLFEGRSETLGPRSPEAVRQHFLRVSIYGGFLKSWVFLLKWAFWGVKWGYHHLRKHPYIYEKLNMSIYSGLVMIFSEETIQSCKFLMMICPEKKEQKLYKFPSVSESLHDLGHPPLIGNKTIFFILTNFSQNSYGNQWNPFNKNERFVDETFYFFCLFFFTWGDLERSLWTDSFTSQCAKAALRAPPTQRQVRFPWWIWCGKILEVQDVRFFEDCSLTISLMLQRNISKKILVNVMNMMDFKLAPAGNWRDDCMPGEIDNPPTFVQVELNLLQKI